MTSNTFSRYIWLYNTIVQFKKISFDEINRRWQASTISDGRPLPLRTFHMHRHAIEEMFDINIECDASDGYKYYIEDMESLKKDRTKQWLINSFSVGNMIEEGKQMPERILLDDVPGGAEFLSTVIGAMRLNRVLKISYRPLGVEDPLNFHLNPYCMKEHRQRWYVMGWTRERKGIRQLAFDRIVSVEMTTETFVYPADFSPEAYYSNDIGISVEEDKPVEVIRIRVYGKQVGLFRSLPLHKSQREVEEGAGYCDFEYHLRINSELKRELLSKANNIEVLEPKHLREEMIREALSILNRYKEDK